MLQARNSPLWLAGRPYKKLSVFYERLGVYVFFGKGKLYGKVMMLVVIP